MRRACLFLFFCLFFPLLAWSTPERPGIGIKDNYPLKDQAIQIFISHASIPLEQFEVSVTYRPNSMVSRSEVLGHPDNNGYLTWTPKEAGITIIKATIPGSTDKALSFSKQISVRYSHFPTLGLGIFLLASLTLFGGLSWTLIKSKPA